MGANGVEASMSPIARGFELGAGAHILVLAIGMRIQRTHARQPKHEKIARKEDVWTVVDVSRNVSLRLFAAA